MPEPDLNLTTVELHFHMRECVEPFACPVCCLRAALESVHQARGWMGRGLERVEGKSAVVAASQNVGGVIPELKRQIRREFEIWREARLKGGVK